MSVVTAPHEEGRRAAQPRPLEQTVGLLVEFDSPGKLKSAARQVRDAGYTRWDTYSPFPIHGMDPAMGIRPTRLPYIVMACGLLGCLTGLGLQYWANATDVQTSGIIKSMVPNFVQGYEYLISGKPSFSLPANIPVIFELTVLLSAFAAVFGMLAMNNLPLHYNPLFNSERFRRVTNDRFFLGIETADPRFDAQRTRRLLESLTPLSLEEIVERPSPPPPTGWLTRVGVVALLVLLIPPSVVLWARNTKKSEPRIHIVQDMDNQEKVKTQKASLLFADGLGSRLPVSGAVARNELRHDDHYFTGIVGDAYVTTFPTHHPAIVINDAFVRRGQRQFTIYCAPCHGLDGAGHGIVNERALALAEPAWVQAASLHDAERLSRPVGQIYNAITNGVRTMPAYGDKISETDRWAVVAYVRALQRAHASTLDAVPAAQRDELQRGRAEQNQGTP